MVKLIGIALIVLGVIALVYQGITYTSKEKILDVGPFKAEVKREKTIPLSPVLGVVALVGGVALLLIAGRRS
jgi:drug/metabolite transporter (DMT)-like permease